MLEYLTTHWLQIAVIIAAGISIFIFISKGAHSVNENEIGIVRKNISLFRSRLIEGEVSANGAAGIQAKVLTSGWYWKTPWIYSVSKGKITVIREGYTGIVTALEGKTKEKGQTFPKMVDCNNFQDAKSFLKNNGCKGTQLDILTPGKWIINPKVFSVKETPVTTIKEGFIGIVETTAGKNLEGEIAGPIISGHNKFQDASSFINNGGFMGLQEEFLDEGQYEINSEFAKIKQVPIIELDAGTVGVVYSRAGKAIETAGADDLVDTGYKGIQKHIYREGKHKFNTAIYELIPVPIHNIKLEWNDEEKKDNGRYDAELRSIEFLSKDKHHFKLPITQIIRIKPEFAPLMLKKMGASPNEIVNQDKAYKQDDSGTSSTKIRYGSVKLFVYRILTDIVIHVLKDTLPNYEGKDFYEQIDTIQSGVSTLIKDRLSYYGVEAVDTVLNLSELPVTLKKIIDAEHETSLQEEIDKKNAEHEMRMANLEKEKEKIKTDSKTYTTQKEIEAVGGIEIKLELERIEAEKNKPVFVMSSIDNTPSSYLDIKNIESFNENKNLFIPNKEVKKKLTSGKKKIDSEEDDSGRNST
jgi:hypothetical protein